MTKGTFGFTIETDEDCIRITQDHGALCLSPHEVDAFVTILKEAQAEMLAEEAENNGLQSTPRN